MEQPERNLYPCPDHLWRGIWNDVAGVLGVASWEVWLGVAVAIGARAHRNIHAKYHGDLWGMMYGLLVKPSGTGKKQCTDTCAHLLPEWYRVRGIVQSGEGLASVLARINRDGRGKVESVEPEPACLVIKEWTSLAKYLKIQNSTLSENLNDLWDGIEFWNSNRSENARAGGELVINKPTLSICATTTEKEFKAEVTPRMISNGFLNRYLVLPGRMDYWQLHDPSVGMDFSELRHVYWPTSRLFGRGAPIYELYTPEGYERFVAWGRPLFEGNGSGPGIMNDTGDDNSIESMKRLHTYAHKIGMLYAWSEGADKIGLPHVEAVITVIETSRKFLLSLMDADPAPPQRVAYELEMKERIYYKIIRSPGEYDVRRLQGCFRRSIQSRDVTRVVAELRAEGRIKKGDDRFLFPA